MLSCSQFPRILMFSGLLGTGAETKSNVPKTFCRSAVDMSGLKEGRGSSTRYWQERQNYQEDRSPATLRSRESRTQPHHRHPDDCLFERLRWHSTCHRQSSRQPLTDDSGQRGKTASVRHRRPSFLFLELALLFFPRLRVYAIKPSPVLKACVNSVRPWLPPFTNRRAVLQSPAASAFLIFCSLLLRKLASSLAAMSGWVASRGFSIN